MSYFLLLHVVSTCGVRVGSWSEKFVLSFYHLVMYLNNVYGLLYMTLCVCTSLLHLHSSDNTVILDFCVFSIFLAYS